LNARFFHNFNERESFNPSRLYACEDAAEALEQIKKHAHKRHRIITGVTVCILEDDEKRELGVGYAFCSFEDQFNKRRGRIISQLRAERDFNNRREGSLTVLKNAKWYFYDEVGVLTGPYASEVLAKNALDEYAEWLNASVLRDGEDGNDKEV
jgi:hypothetical protein